MTTLGFIGGGRITAIFLKAWEAASITPEKVVVSDAEPAVLQRLQTAHPWIETTHDNRIPAAQKIAFIALHPPAIRSALPEIAPILASETIVVSLAPMLDFAALQNLLNGHSRLVRMIPNAPSIIGKGYNPIAYDHGISEEDREHLAPLFTALGEAPQRPETELNAHAILSAMGPTYFWPQWQVLRELGKEFGLHSDTTDRALAAMLHGAVAQLLESGFAFEEVMDTIPVKPLTDDQSIIQAPFRAKLPALHAKLTGAAAPISTAAAHS